MNVDLIEQIKEAENKADEIVRCALDDARKIVNDAKKEAKAMAEDAIDSIAKENDALIKEAQNAAEAEKESINAEAKKGIEALEFLVRPKIDRAADFIIERIVG